jgi:hypothetical protein
MISPWFCHFNFFFFLLNLLSFSPECWALAWKALAQIPHVSSIFFAFMPVMHLPILLGIYRLSLLTFLMKKSFTYIFQAWLPIFFAQFSHQEIPFLAISPCLLCLVTCQNSLWCFLSPSSFAFLILWLSWVLHTFSSFIALVFLFKIVPYILCRLQIHDFCEYCVWHSSIYAGFNFELPYLLFLVNL